MLYVTPPVMKGLMASPDRPVPHPKSSPASNRRGWLDDLNEDSIRSISNFGVLYPRCSVRCLSNLCERGNSMNNVKEEDQDPSIHIDKHALDSYLSA